MSRAQITLSGKFDRDRAVRWIGQAKPGTRVIFKDARRTQAQSDKMWAMLTEVAVQCPWHGQKLTAEDWKIVFLSALKQEMRIVPNIDGTGFVNLGRSSSNLSKGEMSDLIEIISMFGANHGVKFRGDESVEEGQAA
jgi:hypothetical protein